MLVLGTSSGGTLRHVRMLAAGLAAHGATVTVAAPPALRPGFAIPPVHFSPVTIGSHPRPADVRTIAHLRRLLTAQPAVSPRAGEMHRAEAGADAAPVVHAHGLRAGALSALAIAASRRRDRGARGRADIAVLVVTVHNAPPSGQGLRVMVYRTLELIVARSADLVLCVSPDLEQRMRKAGAHRIAAAVVPAPVTTLPRPASASPATPLARPASPSARPASPSADQPSPRPVVLAIGRLAPQKGLGTLLEAAVTWRDMEPVPRVVIAGEGPLLAVLRDQAAALGVDAEFLGHRDDVPALLAACDVFVLPSHWEGQPLILQEALRAGAAIVATRAGGIPALAGPQAARLVPPGNAAALAAGVRAVLTDRALAAGLRAAARTRAASLPTENDAITAALDAYALARS